METWNTCRLNSLQTERLCLRLLASCGEHAAASNISSISPENASGINVCEINLTAKEERDLAHLFLESSVQENRKKKTFLMATRPCVDWHCDGIRDDDDYEMTRSGWTVLLPLRIACNEITYELQVYDQHRSMCSHRAIAVSLTPGLPVTFDQTLLHRVIAFQHGSAISTPSHHPCSPHLFLTWQTSEAYAEERRRETKLSHQFTGNGDLRSKSIDTTAAFAALAEEAIENDAYRRIASAAACVHHGMGASTMLSLDSAIFNMLAFRPRSGIRANVFAEQSRLPMLTHCKDVKYRILKLLARKKASVYNGNKCRVASNRCVFRREDAWGLLFRKSDFTSREAYSYFTCTCFSLPTPKHALILEKGAKISFDLTADAVIVLPLQTRGGIFTIKNTNTGDALVLPFVQGFPIIYASSSCSRNPCRVHSDLPSREGHDVSIDCDNDYDVLLIWQTKLSNEKN